MISENFPCKGNSQKLLQKNEAKSILKTGTINGNQIKRFVDNSSKTIITSCRSVNKSTVKVHNNQSQNENKLPQNKIKNSVFESDVLDDFLKNNSRLNISYEIPTLHAAENLKNSKLTENLYKDNKSTIKKYNNNRQSLLIPKKKPIKVEPFSPDVEIKEEPIETIDLVENNQNYYKNLRTSTKSQKNIVQARYIWVQGRPIEIVNGIKKEDMVTQNKFLKPNFSKSLVSKKSKESQTDFPLLEELEDIKVKIEPEEVLSQVDVKRPRLLTNIASEELECIPKQLEIPDDFRPNFIPVIHNCQFMNECYCKQFSLGMIINIGKGRPLTEVARKNLEDLHYNDNEITERMANIAASAVNTDRNKRIIRRIVVPVVSKNIFGTTNNWYQRLSYDRMAETVPNITSNQLEINIDPEVNKVVEELINYAVIKLDPVEIPFDPLYNPVAGSPKKNKKEKLKTTSKVLRELRKLINVSIIDECTDSVKVKTESECGNDFCIKGCVCNSLNSKMKYALHCGKINCQFKCTCQDKEIYEQNVIKADQQCDVVLAKEELTWHQTIIRSESGNRLEVMNTVDKSKREKKLPTRFRNNVLLGKEMYPSVAPTNVQPKLPAFLPEQQKVLEEGKVILKGESLKKQIMRRRLGYCAGTITGQRSLADVFIWCGIHEKYNCLCVSWICRLKHNAFIWKPEKMTRYLPHKLMTGMELNTNYDYEVFLFDPKRFCARTFGAPIEYNVRNRSSTFVEKRNCEFQNGVISCTNSYIKMKFFMVKDKSEYKKQKQRIEEDFTEVFKASCAEVVKIVSAIHEENYIEICDNLPPVVAEYFPIETDTEEDEDEESSDEQTPQIKCEPNLEPEIDNNKTIISKVYLPAKSVRNVQQPKESLIKLTNRNKSSDLTEQSVPSLTITKVKPDIISFKKIELNSDKRKRTPSDTEPLTISIGDKSTNNIDSSTENSMDNTVSIKKKKLLLSSLENLQDLKTPHLPFKEKIDYELESNLIKLEQHPLKGQVFGFDKLPKLALLCLTPGIGFLPILEFNSDILAVQDPVFPEYYHSFKNLDAANQWLNKFFKNRLIFETIDTSLKWVIVKPGILKLKQSPPFSPALLENPSIVVTKDGGLIFKKKDYNTGGICRGAIKVAPLSLAGSYHQVTSIKDQNENKRKIEQIVDICDGEGKRRKIQIETIPANRPCDDEVKRPVNIFRKIPSVKIQESLIGVPTDGGNPAATLVQNGDGSIFPVNSISSPILQVGVESIRKTASLLQLNGNATPIGKSNIRPLIITGSAASSLRVKVTPTGISNLCSRNILQARSLSPPPLALRSDITTSVYTSSTTGVPMVNALPFSGTRDSRPMLIHNSTLIPINVKSAPNVKIYK